MNIIAINKRLATINPAYSAKFSAAPDNTVDDEITILLHGIPTRWALQLGDGYVGINEYEFENGELVVGAQTLGAAFFLFDYACANRIVWGAEQFQEVRIRHTSGAPDRWLEEIVPVLNEYATASPKPVLEAIAAARSQNVTDRLDTFLTNRFGKGLVAPIKQAFEVDEQRPIETVFDVVTGATAYARGIKHQDRRVQVERLAGELLTLPKEREKVLVAA